MSDMYKQYCDAEVVEHNFEKAKRIVDEMIAINDPDTGKACGSIAWKFLVEYKDFDQAYEYAVKGSEYSDGNSFECLADLNYGQENYKKAYEYLLKAKNLGNEIPDFKINIYKSSINEKIHGTVGICLSIITFVSMIGIGIYLISTSNMGYGFCGFFILIEAIPAAVFVYGRFEK